jgi:eukaryotic-like serine/threonine-protein kinase
MDFFIIAGVRRIVRRSLLGQQLGNYRLISLLGRGGFAEVYLGEHRRLHRQAAIKVLYAYLSEKELDGFQHEAEIIANLDHPHIVRVLDFDVQEGIPFLVMDYNPHGSLRNRHPRGERVPLETVVSYVKQVADALQYAHDQRLIHRDVKPENMLIGRHNEILLSDFGIVVIAHSTSSMSMQESAGTFPYMAPEQIQAHPRPASDQYALGVVTYEWLTGERPFEGTIAELIAKHLTMEAPSLRLKLPSLPLEIEYVVSHALSKEPQQRFTTVRAFAVALEQASQTKDISPASGAPPPAELKLRIDESTPAIVEPRSKPEDTPPAQSYSPTVPASVRAQSVEETAPQTPQPVPRRRFSRRIIVVSLAATAVVAVGGGAIYWMLTPRVLTPHFPYTYRGHSDSVWAVAWAPDGKRIASGSNDETVQVWNATDGSNAFTYSGHSNTVLAVAWSPDGKHIASGSSDNTVQVWNAP